MNARTLYEQGREAHGLTVRALDGRAHALATARLVVAALACALIGVVVWGPPGAARGEAWAALGALAAAFAVLVWRHARVHDARRSAAAALRFHERGLARLSRAWDALPTTSARFADAGHPFARDLDLFGRASLMQLVDGTETRFGEDHLAGLLAWPEAPAGWPERARERQEAARELASRPAFREALATLGGATSPGDRRDVTAMLAWAEASDAAPRATRYLAWALPAIAAGAIAIGLPLGLPAGWIAGIVAVEMVLAHRLAARFAPALEAVSNHVTSVANWRAMISAIERESFAAPALARVRERLVSRGRPASERIASLERLVGFADARRNEGFRFFFGTPSMWDAHCAFALWRWRARAGAGLRGWLEALGEIDALASLGGFAFEHPEFAWPALVDAPALEAEGLGHPLIADDRRVGNDVRLPSAGRALVITGSNMSGKSTLLRAIGVNAALAMAGAPVCARSMRIGPVRIATSMRIDDSLEEGVSHFYAELRRLKQILDRARDAAAAPVLFLLDEILHGTNSRERIVGACAVVRDLVSRGALGAVSTHDLGITALERELAGRVENAHFEEQVRGDEMTFDYVLRAGIVESSNALRLMRAVGIEVP